MILPDLSFEISLWQKGINFIAGIDEVGRGSWAGPLVAAGVILPKNFKIPNGLNDSKLVRPKLRKDLAKFIKKEAVSTYIAEVSANKINKIGISRATQEIFRKIARSLTPLPEHCLIDAFYIKYFNRAKQLAIKHGDQRSASIAAASIIAKVYRDDLMGEIHRILPNYGFNKHKGYGTREHQDAIRKFGFSKIHRTSYRLNFLLS